MTNYNERLDEVLKMYKQMVIDDEYNIKNTYTESDAKQAITSLIKDLVAEAKPEKKSTEDYGSWEEGHRNVGWNNCLDQFEQNLLKALEEL